MQENKQNWPCHLPGSFFVRNDALVIIDLDTVTVVVAGVRATLIPIGPSLGCPGKAKTNIYFLV